MLTDRSKKSIWVLVIFGVIAPIIILGFINYGIVPFEGLSASTKVTINGRTFSFETYISRNFFPILPPALDEHPIAVIIRIIPNDSQAFPSDLILDRLWLINGFDIAVLGFTNVTYWEPPNILKKISRKGPEWDIEKADVIVRLIQIDYSGLRSYFLKAEDQIVHYIT
jgi:hypothetical protein